jgi:DNA-binding transcriptional LysR family regulator
MPDDRFDWNDLRYVLALARCRSLAGAGKALRVDPSSVHRRLVALERRLAVRLFERGSGGYRPTPQGATLIDAAIRIEVVALSAERRIAGTDQKLSGLIRVSTSELLGLYLLPPLLREFGALFPQVALALSIDNRLADLTRRDADIVVRATDSPPANLVGRRIAKIASCAYAERGYLDRMGRARPLESYDWLGLDEGLAHAPQARWLRERVPDARCRFRFNLIEGAHQAARAGMGAAVLPAFVGDPDGELERLTAPEESGDFGVWVLTHPDLRRSARVRAFTREIGAMIAAQEQRLLGLQGPRSAALLAR